MDQRRGSEGSILRGIIYYYYSDIVTTHPAIVPGCPNCEHQSLLPRLGYEFAPIYRSN